MAFPDEALDLVVEMNAAGTWVDITGDALLRDPITITCGQADEGAQVDPAETTLALRNLDGRYSPRNPMSPYYGLIGRNTPIRLSARIGDRSMDLPTSAAVATTTDKASLDILGDIDMRLDATLPNWRTQVDLISKWVPAQQSWFLELKPDGTLTLFWSTDGSNFPSATSTVPVPRVTGRLAVRAVLDVNNGASGNTTTFYTASTIAGTWTQLGDPVTQAGTTSIINSTAPVIIGTNTGGGDGPGFTGHAHAAQIRNSAGTIVANPDFSAGTEGATSLIDTAAAPNTWTLTGGATITNRHIRAFGEVPEWPPQWEASGEDVWVTTTPAGILRRLGQGSRPLDSALYRTVMRELGPVAYWPCEDADGSTQVATPVVGGSPLGIRGTVEFGQDGPAGSSGAISPQGSAQLTGTVTAMTPTSPAGWIVAFWMTLPANFNTGADNSQLIEWFTPGATLARWHIHVTIGTTGRLIMGAFNANMTSLIQSGSPNANLVGKTSFVLIHGRQVGADITADLYVNGVFDDALAAAGTTLAPITGVGINTLDVDPKGSVSHLTVDYQSESAAYLDRMYRAGLGFNAETAGRRMERLCGEENIPFTGIGDLDDTAAMGPQTPLKLLDLLDECADADNGLLHEDRDSAALRYRTRTGTYSQPITLTAAYTQLEPPLAPVDDDQAIRNDITVSRPSGSFARAVHQTGPLSVQAPPDGVGTYDEGLTLNLLADAQLADQAAWRVHQGTWDEARYPSVTLDLAAHPELIPDAVQVQPGHRIRFTGPPPWLPPGPVDLLVVGYTETLGLFEWTITFTCAPAGPWLVAVADDPDLGRADTAGSELAEDLTTTETAVDVATTSGPLWTTAAADMPFDIAIGGEVMTVTTVTGTSSPQTFTVTRSANAIVKTHLTGAAVSLAHTSHLAL